MGANKTEGDGQPRKLLAVFLHGFMGNDTSFQQFPVHLYTVLKASLASTHTVYVKLYPRYRSRRDITFARNDFSRWLEPHESPETDVILLGHSLGGILAAEIALSPAISTQGGSPFRHRILGTINFDTPFLGLHPGIVVSGISSLFRKDPKPPKSPNVGSAGSAGNSSTSVQQTSASTSTSDLSLLGFEGTTGLQTMPDAFPDAGEPGNDPDFNPAFDNDVRLQDREGWGNFLHFINKHSGALREGVKQYLMSHLQHGGCLADYRELRARHNRLRALEDVDDFTPRTDQRRIRFVNYYTLSTGRPNLDKEKSRELANLTDDGSLSLKDSITSSPELGFRSPLDDELEMKEMTLLSPHPESEYESSTRASMEIVSREDSMDYASSLGTTLSSGEDHKIDNSVLNLDEISLDVTLHQALPQGNPRLPSLPMAPTQPDKIDLDVYTDKDVRKVIEKHHKRLVEAYERAVKDRDAALQDRRKLLQKLEKRKIKEQKEKEKEAAKLSKTKSKEKLKLEAQPSLAADAISEQQSKEDSNEQEKEPTKKKKKAKKFCMLPMRMFGSDDNCWIPVHMDGVDEVGAHCGLFFPGPHYDALLGDVANRIEEWLAEDASRRAVMALRNASD